MIRQELVAVYPDGDRVEVVASVQPLPAREGVFACLIELSPYQEARSVYGGDPFQALFLDLRFLRFLMQAEEIRGATFFVDEGGRLEPIDWLEHWFGPWEIPQRERDQPD